MPVHYVYLICSQSDPSVKYIGITSNLKGRIARHNEGGSPHTAEYKPWNLVNYFAFTTREKAFEFERYLKTGSGRAFANRHFW